MDRRKLIFALLLLTLISVGAYSTQIKNVGAGKYVYHLRSAQDNHDSEDLGTIIFNGDPKDLPFSALAGLEGEVDISYVPERGYCFLRWEYEGGVTIPNVNANPTTATVGGEDFTITAVYEVCAPSNPTGHVGGELFSPNKTAVLAPYLMALFSVIAVGAVVLKRRRT